MKIAIKNGMINIDGDEIIDLCADIANKIYELHDIINE